jgi:hypothetical protein
LPIFSLNVPLCGSFYATTYQRQKIQQLKPLISLPGALSVNNPNCIPLIYQKLEIKETTETTSSVSFLDNYFKFDANGKLSTRIYDKRNFNFDIMKFPHLNSSIQTAPAYEVYISQLTCYNRDCRLYLDFTTSQ